MASGGTYVDTPERGFVQADTTITGPKLRVKLTGSSPFNVTLAGAADEDIGVSKGLGSGNGWGVTGDALSVSLATKQGTMPMTASGAISLFAKVYPDASGKITATANGKPLGIALEAATGDGSQIEVLRYAKEGPIVVADPGTGKAIPVQTDDFDVSLTIAASASETNTLGLPLYQGQKARISADTVGASGTRAITCSQAINASSNTVITFDAVRDMVELVGITVAGALRWQVLTNVNVALS